MKKTYEPETKSAIEQVIDVFNDYIRTSTVFGKMELEQKVSKM